MTTAISPTGAPTSPPTRRPYPGLRPFGREDAELFFGRDAQVDQLLDKLAESRFLAVLGTSGAGKSSLVRAGLLPALDSGVLLREGGGSGPIPGSRWSSAELRPGAAPFTRLAAALLTETRWADTLAPRYPAAATPAARTAALEADLRRGAQALAWLLGIAPLPPGERLLILVDQFEELFRYHRADSADAAAFVALLLGAVAHPDCHVVITLRSEFLGQCARFPDLPEAINAGLFLTPRLRPVELADAIARPPRLPACNGEVDLDLVRDLLDATAWEQDQLPLLQHLLMRLWDQALPDAAGHRRLDRAGLGALGGLRAALNDHAEEALAELDAPGQRVAEVLFRALTERGADGEWVRRPVGVAEVAAVAGCTVDAVLAAAAPFRRGDRSFLMPPAAPTEVGGHGGRLKPAPPGADLLLDITHEALIRQWQQLARWTADEAEQADLYRHLTADAALWPTGCDPWTGPRLQAALDWRERHQPGAAWARRYGGDFGRAMAFLEAGVVARDAAIAAERERARAALRRAWVVAGSAMVALALTLALAGWAWVERQGALAAEGRAEGEKQHSVESLFESRLTHAALLARVEDYAAAWRVIGETVALDPRVPADRRHARNLLAGLVDLRRGVADLVYRDAGASLIDLALSPDGRWLVAGGERGTLVVFDAATGELVKRLEGHDPTAGSVGAVKTVRFTADGTHLYSAGQDEHIRRWTVADWRPAGDWQAPAAVFSIALSPDGARLASGGADDAITIWSTATGKVEYTLTGESSSIADGTALAFLPDGRLVAGGYNGQVGIWDLDDGKEQVLPRIHTDQVPAIAVSPDGSMIASGSSDQSIVLWDAASGRPLRRLRGHQNKILGLTFDPSGQALLSASYDNTLRLWDLASGATLRVFQGHAAGLWSVLVRADQDGVRAYTAANDGTLRRWPLGDAGKPAGQGAGQWLWDLTDPLPHSILALPDRGLLLVGGQDGTLLGLPLPAAPTPVGAAPGRDPVAPTTAGDGPTDPSRLQAAPTGAASAAPAPLFRIANAHEDSVKRIVVAPDGETIATGSLDGVARLWRLERDPPGLTPLHRWDQHQGAVHGLAFSPDGRLLATAGYDGQVGLFDLSTGDGALTRVASDGQVLAVAFTPDGKELIAANRDERRLTRWHRDALRLTDGETIANLADRPLWATLSPDGRRVAVVGRGALGVSIFPVPPPGATGPANPAPLRLTGHEQTVFRAAFLPDGHQLATVSSDMTVRLWDLGPAAPGTAPGAEPGVASPPAGQALWTLPLPTRREHGVPLWDFDLHCTADQAWCWIAVPLTIGRIALYRLPYADL